MLENEGATAPAHAAEPGLQNPRVNLEVRGDFAKFEHERPAKQADPGPSFGARARAS